MVDHSNIIKIIDFDTLTRQHETKQIVSSGNIHFLTPEKISSNCLTMVKTVANSLQTDVYQIGLVCYYILYEIYPIKGPSWKSYSHKVVNGIQQFNSETPNGETIPLSLINMLKKALSVNPDNRYRSANQMYNEFNKKVNGKP